MQQTKKALQRITSRRGLVGAAAGSVAAVGIGAIPARCMGKIYPGVHVLGVDVSGMTPNGAGKVLREELAPFESHAVTFVYGDRSWKASLADLGFSIDYRSMLDTAMVAVRSDGVLERYVSVIDREAEYKVPFYLQQDPDDLAAFMASIAEDVRIEPLDARLYKSGRDISILEHQVGQELDVEHATSSVLRSVRSGRTATIELRTRAVEPDVTSAQLHAVKADAQRMIGEPVTFVLDDREYVFDSDDLASALVISEENRVSLDVERLQDRIDQVAADVLVPARNVKLGWDGGLYVVENDVEGRRLDAEALATRLIDLSMAVDRIDTVPVVAVRAPARTDNLHELGVETHLAAGSSSFAGSSYERAANVAVSAKNVSYKLVAPGEEFSFNDLLGPITEEYGYIAGSIIQGDFAATDIGGGVCQVSTTVFRAAQNAGFRFSEWNPHSWRLAFYEADGSSPGLDAAIYQPNNEWEYELDLRFENPLDSWLLLQVVVDGEWVSAHFYGKDPGWTVEVFPARIGEPKPIPQPIEKVNPALEAGERRLVQRSSPGYTVWVRRRVSDADGNVIADGDFVSDYVSQPEVYEVGPA